MADISLFSKHFSTYGNRKVKNTPSFQTLKGSNQLSIFNRLTSIKGQPIKDLQATNNVLTIDSGAYYRLKLNGQSMLVSGLSNVHIGVPYEDIANELNVDPTFFSTETYQAFDKTEQFLTALNDRSTYLLRQNYTNSEILDYCSKLGIKPGGWVEINNQGRVNRFYLEKDGTPWSEGQIESARSGIASVDWRKNGCTEDSILIVNGKEYKMDENGHFNIPKGEPVIYHNGMVVFPKESDEFTRQKYNWPEPASQLDKFI